MATATKTSHATRSIERRLAAVEKALEQLRKVVGDLKYEIEQMREE
jgi:cell division protein FtsB